MQPTMALPELSRVPEFYHNYISLVHEDEIMDAFEKGSRELINFFGNIPPEKTDYRYAEGKWSIKEVLQHIIDAERVFSYRALCFARKDATPLPGFDENSYAKFANADNRDWRQLLEEFRIVRKSSELLFTSFDAAQLNASGLANNNSSYVLGIGFIIVGHSLHHMKVIKEKYL